VTQVREAPSSDAGIWDSHDRREAEHDLERFFALTVDLICVVDVDGRFLRVSPSFTSTLGYDEAKLLDGSFLDFVHPDDMDDALAEVGRLLDDAQARRFQTRYRHRDGHWVWLSWTARSDSTGRTYAIGRDVTDERRARDELARRAAELELTNEELEQFAYVASHDLQEPLRTLTSYAELVREEYGDRLDADGRDFLGFMTDAASRMRALILALLDYSRLGRHALKRGDVDLNQVTNAVLRDLEAAIKESGARIDIGQLPKVSCDPILISVVLQNLVCNAIKFRRAAAVRVSLTAERTGLGWRFGVQDNGIGIKEEHRERVFEVFKRLHPPHKYEGTGIGLAICRRIVQQHGGTIWCTANPGEGSTFHFTLLSGRRS